MRHLRALYLCYFGIDEPLVQTQVLPYLRELRASGVDLQLLTFEPRHGARSRARADPWRTALKAQGIEWSWLPYHARPTLLATAYDIVRGAWRARSFSRRSRIDVFHGRSHVGAAMGAIARRLTGAKLVFDVRGFLPEEYVDAGVWPAGGLLFRLTKRAERMLFRAADGLVLLTNRARDMVFPGATDSDAAGRPIEIIPTCVDTAKFTVGDDEARRSAKSALGLNGRRVLAHVGALDGWVATDTLAELITIALRRDPRIAVIILTKSSTDRFAHALRQRGVDSRAVLVRQAAPDDVPGYLHAVDAGVAIYLPSESEIARSPTRIGEYLAAGVPALCSPHVGDVDEVLTGDRVGIVTRGRSADDLEDALERLDALTADPDLRTRCRATALARFDLRTVGGARYRRLYDRVMAAPA